MEGMDQRSDGFWSCADKSSMTVILLGGYAVMRGIYLFLISNSAAAMPVTAIMGTIE